MVKQNWRGRMAIAVGLAAVVAVTTSTASAAKNADATWSSKTPVPAATEGASTAAVGNQIVLAYGYPDNNVTRLYNIDTDSWSLGAPAPGIPSAEGIAVSHGGSMYALGGRNGAGHDNNRYTPETNTWTELAPMPTARDGLGAAVVGDAIYALSGRPQTAGPCSGTPIADVQRYDIDSNSWSERSPMPDPRSDAGVVAHGGRIYVFGGCNFGAYSNRVDIYDPAHDSWTRGASMPTPRAGFYGVGVKGNNIYVMGGETSPFTASAANEVYNTARNTWSESTPMPHPRGEMGVVSHGGQIYTIAGGMPARGTSTNYVDVFKP